MRKFKKFLKWFFIVVLILVVGLAIFLRLRYGGGTTYKDISTAPKYNQSQTELFFSYPEPIGNVAASSDTSMKTRVFFTIHPESRPETNKLMEIVNGKAVPYPNAAAQSKLFNTVLGVFVDAQNRLWTIDHGQHGFKDVKLLAFDLKTNQLAHEYVFPGKVGESFSFFNDLTVSPDGRYVFVADVSFLGRNPSLVVYDTQTKKSRRLLDNHPSVKDEGYVPVTPAKKMRFFGGVVDLLTGIDGLDLSRDGKYVYYAPMGGSGLYRVLTATCVDFSKSLEEVAKSVERIADKPLSDGIRTDEAGNVYITDIEHQGIYVVTPEKKGYTLIKDKRIRWADGLALASDGYFYLADSDIPNQMLQSKSHMRKYAPYHIYRFKRIQSKSS